MYKIILMLMCFGVSALAQNRLNEILNFYSSEPIYDSNFSVGEATNGDYLAFFTLTEIKGISLKVYDNKKKMVFKFDEIDKCCKNEIKYSQKIYFIKNHSLFEFSFPNVIKKLDTIKLKDSNIENASVWSNGDRSLLVLNYIEQIEIYELNSGKQLMILHRKTAVRNPTCEIVDDYILFQSDANLLTCYALSSNKNIWEYDFGVDKIYILGIKVGEVKDRISNIYHSGKVKNLLFVNTFGGNIYKLDMHNGSLIQKKMKISGTSNNAGLIPNFQLYDYNKDGVEELIGGSVDHNLYCIDGKSLNTVWKQDLDNEIQLPVSLFDINGDGLPDIFTVTDYDTNLFILDGKDGSIIFRKSVKQDTKPVQSKIEICHFLGKNNIQLLINISYNEIKLFELLR